MSIPDMLGCAKELGLDGERRMARWEELASANLPLIASFCDGNFVLVAAVDEDKITIATQASQRRQEMSRAEFGGRLGRSDCADRGVESSKGAASPD